MSDRYLNTKDICDRFRCSSRTVWRRMRRDENPFPQPLIKNIGASNLWCVKAVAEWEDREIERTALEHYLQEQAFISESRDKDADQLH